MINNGWTKQIEELRAENAALRKEIELIRLGEDRAKCPYCNEDFAVREYGHQVHCPSCDGMLDIFPDAMYFVHTPVGTLEIGVVK